MLIICLVFWESELQYAYKRYAYKKTTCSACASSLIAYHIAIIGKKI